MRCAALVASVALYTVAGEDPLHVAFKQFKAKWSKKYGSVEEELERYNAFSENYKLVLEENAKGHAYELEMNKFADFSDAEFAAYSGKSKKSKKTWGLKHLGTHRYSGKDLPEEWDWVPKGAVTPVKDQGLCGSCLGEKRR